MSHRFTPQDIDEVKRLQREGLSNREARLKVARPDLYQRFVAGEMPLPQAETLAGMRARRVVLHVDVERVARLLANHYRWRTPELIEQLHTQWSRLERRYNAERAEA